MAVTQEQADTDLAIVGAGVAACSLVAALRQQGWAGSVTLLESGRGPGGRAATRRSRRDLELAIDHGAPLFNVTASGPPALLRALQQGGWIRPFEGAIRSLDGAGQIGAALDDGLTGGSLWQGSGGMDRLAAGLLALAGGHAGVTQLRSNTLVRRLRPTGGPRPSLLWALERDDGTPLLRSRWLVLSGTLLAHPRCQQALGWEDVPLQQAAAALDDAQLHEAAAALAAIEATASSNLLLRLPPEQGQLWLQQGWRLLQFTPAAQQRWGLRRVSLQPSAAGHLALVAESSPDFATRHHHVYGSRSSAAQRLGTAPDSAAEAAVLDSLECALQQALGLPTAGAERQLMRWGAAFPKPPGLPVALQLCAASRLGFCGDYVQGRGLGRVEGAMASAGALAERLLPLL